MVPRADIAAVPVDVALAELVRVMNAKGHSRLPVYRETLDDVIGMVHIKDVLTSLTGERPFDLK
jgi:CBS domain containing-hemolysin-like protein